MRNLWVLLMVLLICALIITGCSTSTPSPTTPVVTTSQATVPVATTPQTTVPPTTAPVSIKPTTSTPAASQVAATTAPTSTKYGGFLRYIDPNAPGTTMGSPWETNGGPQFSWLGLQTPLTQMVDGSLVPNIAESYEVVTDPAKPSVTFHIRKGVKFSDGTDLNAQAVKWNFDKAKEGNMTATVISYWKSIDLLDDYTLRVNFTTWLNKSVASFSNNVAAIVSPTALEKNGVEWMRTHIVGTGPFIQTDFQRDISLTMARNPNYWDAGKPYLDKFQFLWVPDQLTRLALFKSGGAELMNIYSDGRIAQELQNAGYKIINQFNYVDILIPDSADADSPWSSLKVRQAAEYAIDKQSIAKTLGYGFWEANDQLNTPNSMAYDKTIEGRKYDVAKAKQLLTEAGYPNGFKTKLIALNSTNMDALVAIQSYFSKVGIQSEVQPVTPSLFNTYSRTGSPYSNSIVLYHYAINANPTQGMNGDFGMATASWKYTIRAPGWGDALSAAMTSAKLEPALLQKAERIFYDNVMAIALYSQSSLMVMAPNVQNSGIGTFAAVTTFASQNTWLSK